MKPVTRVLVIAALLLTASCALAQPSGEPGTLMPVCKDGKIIGVLVKANHAGLTLFKLTSDWCEGRPDTKLHTEKTPEAPAKPARKGLEV